MSMRAHAATTAALLTACMPFCARTALCIDMPSVSVITASSKLKVCADVCPRSRPSPWSGAPAAAYPLGPFAMVHAPDTGKVRSER